MKNTVILVNSNGMGKADETLQQILFAKYVELTQQNGDLPMAFCFYTEGVKLVCEGSPIIEELRGLEALAAWAIFSKRRRRQRRL